MSFSYYYLFFIVIMNGTRRNRQRCIRPHIVTREQRRYRRENIPQRNYKWVNRYYNPSNIFARARSRRVTWADIPQLKLGNIRDYSTIFKTMCVAKKIRRIRNTIASIWGENMLGYLSLDIICSS